MPNITVNEDLTSHTVSDDGTKELFLAPHNPMTIKRFTSKEEVEQFINENIDKYNWWQPFVDPAVREQELFDVQAKAVREERSKLLAESDWVVVFHTEKGTNIPLEWEVYRQALRDVTTQDGFPHNVIWPSKP